MVDRIRYPTVSYLPFIISFFEIDFQFLLLTIFNLQANILTTNDILSNLGSNQTLTDCWLEIEANKTKGRIGGLQENVVLPPNAIAGTILWTSSQISISLYINRFLRRLLVCFYIYLLVNVYLWVKFLKITKKYIWSVMFDSKILSHT